VRSIANSGIGDSVDGGYGQEISLRSGELLGTRIGMHFSEGHQIRRRTDQGWKAILRIRLGLFVAALMQGMMSVATAAEPNPANRPDPGSHWSFRPVHPPAVPSATSSWGRNPVDAFLSDRHRNLGLRPVEPASPNVLLRRLYIDLVGVPPTTAELQDFVSDPSEERYVEVVERLLASPRHGERWGRHWMDVWRYSDWAGHGAEVRESQPHIWRWRDWIVESVNTDKPYDQMIVEMLAADELAPLDSGSLRATGFLVRNWFRYNRNVWIEATVEHTAKAFLGLTVNCARCHEHKSDPISQMDFYRMRAFFEPYDIRTVSMTEGGDPNANSLVQAFDGRLADPTFVFTRGDEARPETNQPVNPQILEFLMARPAEIREVTMPLESFYPALTEKALKSALALSDAAVSTAEKKAEAAWATALAAEKDIEASRLSADLASHQAAFARAEGVALRSRIVAERLKQGLVPGDLDSAARAAGAAEHQVKVAAAEVAVAEAVAALQKVPRAPKPNDPAATGAPESKPDPKLQEALAAAEKKLAESRDALGAARKAALEPSTNYTALGPVYPKTSTGRRLGLARWIAHRDNPLTARVAMNQLWMRHMGSPLVPTVFDFGRAGQPPTHPELLDWLAAEFLQQNWSLKAMHRLIVTSSAYRMKTSGGTVAEHNHAKDPDNRYLWRMNVRRVEAEVVRDSLLQVSGGLDSTMGGPELDQGAGESSTRRSLYFRHAKEKVMEFTQTFDGPGVAECYRRDESIVPQQALALANSVLVKSQSRRLAQTLSDSLGEPASDEPFIRAAFTRILGRPPTPEEMAACQEFLGRQAALLSDPSGLTPASVGDASQVPPSKDPIRRAKEDLIVVLLNHNDFVSIR